MTATEVARNFSAALDSVANGETVLITRGGQQLAKLVPAPQRTAPPSSNCCASGRVPTPSPWRRADLP
jgi:antitoxin (DNA-binding transcriptional repressor) of toxin-antitoxin stability system